MSVSRANLGRGPAYLTIGGATLFTRDDLIIPHAPEWAAVGSSLHGQFDKFRGDLVIKHNVTLFGHWANLSVLFPSAVLNPVPGTSLFGTNDSAMVIQARNNDRITYHNSQITKLTDLFLGVESELFAAALEITSLIKNNANPEDASSYFTRDTNAYSDATAAFATTNFKKSRFTGAWAGKTGLTSFAAQDGFKVSWALDLQSTKVDGLGTVDMHIGPGGLVGTCRCIPIGPTQAQIDTAQDVEQPQGTLLSTGAADLTLTGTGVSVVLKNACLVSSSTAFGVQPLRVGEVAWETTRAFATGAPSVVASVS